MIAVSSSSVSHILSSGDAAESEQVAPVGMRREKGGGVSGRLESFKNVGGVICVCSDLPYSQLMVSNVASVCMCVSGVGFDREVENWRMSLRSELVAVEA